MDTKPFDAADYLTDVPRIMGYLRETIALGDADAIQLALDDVERALTRITAPAPARSRL